MGRRAETVIGTAVTAAGRGLGAIQGLLRLQAPARPLTAAETGTLRRVYRGSLDLTRLALVSGRSGLFGLSARPFTLGNLIYMKRVAPGRWLEVLVHEACHAWQYQHEGVRYAGGAILAQATKGPRAYDWQAERRAGKSWPEMNREAQAQMIQDLYRLGRRGTQVGNGAFFDETAADPGSFVVAGEDLTGFARASLAVLRGGMNRLAIFDCDGTLVDGQAAVCRAVDRCFAEAGLPAPPAERTRRIVGLSLVEAMRDLLPDAEPEVHARLAEDYKRVFQALRAQGDVEEPLYEGVPELLDTLEADGWLLGVATGKSDRGLRLCLERHGLARRFVTLQTADRHPSKPHPSMIAAALAETGAEPHLSVMIGDTIYDVAMARSAGVAAIGVAWGYHEADELTAAGAEFVARTPAALAQWIGERA